MATAATSTSMAMTEVMATVTATSSQVQENRHGLILGLGQTAVASARQSNDLQPSLLLRFQEGEGRDRQKSA